MRLLDTKTGRFKWFEDPRQVRYAILSHVWSKDGEQSFRDVQQRIDAAATGTSILDNLSLSDKIKSFCRVAQEHGFDFGWVDSCCIDKTSSSELSEAITSMYDWYRHADMCFAYLHDVDSREVDSLKRNKQFCGSQWFQRGWTLQELLAPSILLFLSSSWHVIGSKQTSATLIAKITTIDRDVLTFKRSLDEVTVACRMSWAASRRTTREEDEAYCLMGIFGVSFPIIYGEGRHAFVRLQEEIIKTIPDQTIFAWGRILGPRHPFTFELPNDSAIESIPNPYPIIQHSGSPSNQYLLASSPADYLESSHIIPLSRDEFAQRVSMPLHFTYQVFTVTAHGIHVRLPLIAIAVKDRHETFPTHLALLACETQDNGHLLALLLRPQLGNAGSGFSVGAVVVNQSLTPAGFLDPADLKDWHYRAVFLSLQDIHHSLRRKFIRTANLYLPHRPLRGVSGTDGEPRIFRGLWDPQDNLEVHLSGWSRTLLSLDESRLIGDDDPIVLRGRRLNPHLAPWLVIAYKGLEGVHINIQIGRCECPLGRHSGTVLLGALVWSPHAWSSLEQRFEEEYHRLNHPVHLHSWAYRDGVASTDVELRPFSSPREWITVHLTLYHPSEQTTPNVYQLGVEVASTEAQAEFPNLQVQRRDRGKSATHDVAFPSFQEGYYRAETASYMPSDRLSVRDRAQSQTFYAPSSDDSWILPSPPLTAANSKSSNHTTNGWSLFLSRPGHAAQGHPKAASHWQGRSSSWDARPPLAEEQAKFALSAKRHSFEDEEGRAQNLRSRPDEYSLYARNAASSVGDGRVLFSQLPTRTSSPSPIATSADVGTYSLDLGDFRTRGHSHNLRGKTLDGEGESVPATARMLSPSGDFEKGDPVASNSGSKHRTDPHSHPALPGPFDDAQQGLNRAALDLRVVLEPDHNAPPRVGRPEDPSPRSSFVRRSRARSEPDSPRDPDMGGGGSSPKTLWAEGGDPPPRLALQPPKLAADSHPSADTPSSNHLPQSSDIRSVPAAGEVSSATGRNGSRTRNVNGVDAPLPTSQVPNTVGTDNKIFVQSFASATTREKRTNGQPERRQSRGHGTYKDSKRRIGSGFMRGIQFFRRLASSS